MGCLDRDRPNSGSTRKSAWFVCPRQSSWMNPSWDPKKKSPRHSQARAQRILLIMLTPNGTRFANSVFVFAIRAEAEQTREEQRRPEMRPFALSIFEDREDHAKTKVLIVGARSLHVTPIIVCEIAKRDSECRSKSLCPAHLVLE